MIDNAKLSKKLSRLLTNNKFMLSIMENEETFSKNILYKMGIVLQYYITTRDENVDYTYQDIEERYFHEQSDNEQENIIENGFMTHSFNGYKKNLILKNGLDYEHGLNPMEKQEIIDRRNLLNQLEDVLGISPYVQSLRNNDKDRSDTIYICPPGAKTFHYACKRSPERLYEGPLKGYEKEPQIVGETKSSYLTRILFKKIDEKAELENWNMEKYNEAVELAKKVANSYGNSQPSFAMISIKDIKNVDFSQREFDETRTEKLQQKLERAYDDSISGARAIFSREASDAIEVNNLGDLVTLAEYIPKDSINIVDCMDSFQLNQLLAKSKGLRTGDYIDYSKDKKSGSPTLAELIGVIDDCKDLDSLQELQEKFEKTKAKTKSDIQELSKSIQSEYGGIAISDIKADLLKRKQELENEKQTILNRSYEKKYGIDCSYTLRDSLQELKDKGLMQELLQSDETIKNDELQYESNLHGASHTRRVNFFAALIMNSEGADDKTKTFVRAFVINHDIGRKNDYEDKQHGENSANILEDKSDRMAGLDDIQKEQLKFVIKEHSLSTKQNHEDINNLFAEKIQDAKVQRFNRMSEFMKKGKKIEDMPIPPSLKREQKSLERLLAICKDADKLDRVRLDSTGIDSREGLDSSRLSLESSKKFENVAYESLDKITRILDIEKELQSIEVNLELIDRLRKLQNDYKCCDGAEQKFFEKREKCNQNKRSFLTGIVKNKRLSKIALIPKKIKEMFLSREDKRGDLDK